MADTNLSIFESTLPDTTTKEVTAYDTATTTVSGLPSYLNVTISNGGLLNGVYDAWCINSSFGLARNTYDNSTVYSSYGTIPAGILYTGEQTVNASSADPYLDKLQQINWLLNNVTEASNLVNNTYRYGGVDYTWGDVQLAIWKLLGETSILDSTDFNSLEVYSQQKADDLVTLATINGSDFLPVAGNDIGVIVKASGQQPILLEVKTSGIGDFVWEDLNANGIQDGNEAGINGATVTLLDANGNVLSSTITGDNPYTAEIESGYYQFGPLLPSNYQVRFTLPTDFNAVSPYLQGNNSLDSDANPNNNLTSNLLTLVGGEINKTIDAGFYKYASLGDFVFNDSNVNGIQDAEEVGVSGVTVQLINPTDGSVIGTTTTDSNGAYTFTGLTPGEYQVQFSAPTGYSFTSVNQGTDDAQDSDANPSTGLTQTVTLTSGEFNGTLDAGLVQLARLGDRVWHDINANGIQDAGEVGIAEAGVNLLNASGNVIATTNTDADGLYSFSNLQPGDYKVQFVQPNGFNGVSPVNQGGDDSIDADADTNLTTGLINLSAGENDPTIDAGFYKTASLGDFVFNDSNVNGIQDAGEVGVSGVTVTLISGGADGIINGIGDTTVTTTTNGSGNYGFTGLTPGQEYQVEFSNLPTGYQFTQADAGSNDGLDSDADPSTGKTQIVTLSSGENNTTLDAGIYQNAGDLSITKTDNLTTVTPGQQITYTIVAQNNGLVTATNALVSDIIPSNLTNVTWTSVAAGGATDNQTSGTGNINDYVTLTAGSSITYTVNGTVATNALSSSPTSNSETSTFNFNGNSALDGTNGNIRTFSVNDVSVKTSAFSRDSFGTWKTAYLGSFTGGLGVTDSSEGDGGNGLHRVDNVGRNNYILFEFSESVIVDRAFLDSVVDDSDISVWIGNFNNPYTNHLTLSDSVLSSFGFSEVNLTGSSSDRWANFNASNNIGNTLVIAAWTQDSSPDDRFKIHSLDIQQPVAPTTVSLSNTATVTAATGFTDTNLNNNSATDTNTVIAVSTVKIGDRVWYDADGDGIQDTGESGVGGVNVKLFNQAGTQIGLTTTNAHGLYEFTVKANHTYSVQFDKPTDFDGFSPANVGNDAADSDVVNANGKTASFSVGTSDDLTIDAGLIKNIGDLSITKNDCLTLVTPGQEVTYTIVVSNDGLMTVTNALVSDLIPSLLTNVTWSSVATGGATGNELHGTGSIDDYVTLTSGSSITYTVNGTVATNALSSAPTSNYETSTFNFEGNSATDGTDGNVRTFSVNGVSVKTSAFSRDSFGTWKTAYLGSYTGGLGVTDSSEGSGSGGLHRVDNLGRNNYVLFEFSESVSVDRAELDYVIDDSDISVWIGNFNNPFSNHLTLNNTVLSNFGFSEVNLTGSSSDRWADINASQKIGNTLVIAAKTGDSNDQFKIRSLDIQKPVAPTTVSLSNTATVTAPTGFTDTNLNNNSATDTDTVIAAPGVRTPGFWHNTEWQKFWDGVQGNEPSEKTDPKFPDCDLLFAPHTNSAQPGKVLDPVSGQYDIGLLIGDYNLNGKTDAGENTLFYTHAQALQIVDSSAQPNLEDKRYDLGSSLVASWLNYLAGNPIDTANQTDKDARHYINQGINWLQASTPDENGDHQGDGALNQLTGSVVNSLLANTYWNLGISSASGLLSPHNSDTNVVDPLDAGSVIHTALDNYNNGLGLADHVFSGGNS
ncbi:conserved repeat protein [Cylindrospermum stagnale PCC 7417]|uniref:Conserved repeat protein n=1 Tax=Cylindrospermum stagnale PCC 7417 TaxID=56107 RepID=K9X6H1_9NOST|nr:SdrD B-like domain-containing protein [Cylindrospermum stagnale]AFZ28073.1 conserved repeat protein [Cylindrospermum stagnale PCC 7417]